MSKAKHIPQRKCCGCGKKFDKPELLRIVRINSGEQAAKLDVTGKCNAQGRGAYICKNKRCIETAEKKRAAERSLRLVPKKSKSPEQDKNDAQIGILEKIYGLMKELV